MTDTNSSTHAIIIGGSIGGLLTAACLRAVGWTVTVFERSPGALDSCGGGLVLQPAVEEAPAFAGISQDTEFGVPSRDRIFVERDGSYRRMYMPQMQIAWNGLYQRLREALPTEALHLGESLQSISHEDDGVTAHFPSRRRVRGEVLIGAGGPLSRLRELMLPGSDPRYAGYAAWRGRLYSGASHLSAMPPLWLDPTPAPAPARQRPTRCHWLAASIKEIPNRTRRRSPR